MAGDQAVRKNVADSERVASGGADENDVWQPLAADEGGERRLRLAGEKNRVLPAVKPGLRLDQVFWPAGDYSEHPADQRVLALVGASEENLVNGIGGKPSRKGHERAGREMAKNQKAHGVARGGERRLRL